MAVRRMTVVATCALMAGTSTPAAARDSADDHARPAKTLRDHVDAVNAGDVDVAAVPVLGSTAGEGPDPSSDEAAIRANVAAFEAAWNARDAAGVTAIYAADGDLVRFDGPRVTGRDALRRVIAADLARLPIGRQIRLTVTGIRQVRPDIVVVETTAEFNGGAVRKDRGTWVMVRENGRWLGTALRVYPAEASAVAGAPPDRVTTADEDQRGVVDARARLIQAIEADDLEGILASLTADHVTMPPDGPALADVRALRTWHEQRIAAFSMKASWVPDDLRVDGDEAVDSWHGFMSLAPRDGSATVSVTAKGVWLWRRGPDARWRLARSIWNTNGPGSSVDLGAERTAVEKLVAAQRAATNQAGEAGADGYVSVAADDILWLPPNGGRVIGRKAVRDRALQFTSARHWSTSWKADLVDVAASGDLAYAVGTYELSFEDAGGGMVRDSGKFLDAFKKQADGSWKMTVIIYNSDLPAGGVPQPGR